MALLGELRQLKSGHRFAVDWEDTDRTRSSGHLQPCFKITEKIGIVVAA
jgi:hypothetical protein